jgi:hypothetical protein
MYVVAIVTRAAVADSELVIANMSHFNHMASLVESYASFSEASGIHILVVCYLLTAGLIQGNL